MAEIPIVLCIDVEPDDRDIGSASAWSGFLETFDLFNRVRRRWQSITSAPVRFAWFLRMDPQVAHAFGSTTWVVEQYGDILRRLEQEGDELALHVHPWRWSDGWIADFGNQAWIEHCVRSGVAGYWQAFSRPCTSFRFGDHWLNDETVELLQELDIRCDLTIEPGASSRTIAERFSGSLPDYRNAVRVPYRPLRGDFLSADTASRRGLVLVPVSSGSVHALPLPADRRPAGTVWAVTRGNKLSTGTLIATPNPVPVSRLSDCGVTTLTWTAEGASEVAVHVDAPDGPLFHGPAPPRGSAQTGEWVAHDQIFYLQDVSGGLPLTEANTLATARVHLTATDEADDRSPTEHLTLNLGLNSPVFCRIANEIMTASPQPFLVVVARSDVGSRKRERDNFEQSIEYLSNHPLARRFIFETPTAFLTRFDAALQRRAAPPRDLHAAPRVSTGVIDRR